MRKHRQRSKSANRDGVAISAAVLGDLWEQKTDVWLGDNKPQAVDSSDTDDNSPPKEPPPTKTGLHRDKKRNVKLHPSMIPSHFVNLNYLPSMPLNLRVKPPTKPRIFKSLQCTKSTAAKYVECIPDSLSEEENEVRPFRSVYTSVFHIPTEPQFRPKSAPFKTNTLKPFSTDVPQKFSMPNQGLKTDLSLGSGLQMVSPDHGDVVRYDLEPKDPQISQLTHSRKNSFSKNLVTTPQLLTPSDDKIKQDALDNSVNRYFMEKAVSRLLEHKSKRKYRSASGNSLLSATPSSLNLNISNDNPINNTPN